MRVYISADMEGVTGVTHPDDVIPGRPRYEAFRRLLTADVNAAIEGARRAGAREFLVNEAHDGMRNLLLEDLDPGAEVIVGSRKPLSMMEGCNEADLVFFVGYHSAAGTGGILSHTFTGPSTLVRLELNGEVCSEGRMNAAFAGLAGIPVGLVTGDDLICAESEALYPGVRTACVKTAVDRYTARCLSPGASRERIRRAAFEAVSRREYLSPYAPEGPYTFTAEFASASTAESVMYFPGLKRLDDRRVCWTHEDYETAFRMFIGVMRLARTDPDYG
ncbi:MAG: M55 family metallopeptidase [Rubrobacteraceae bacterium]|nr:M55 family metallopeptidase [Rubrobacteraceae bacterium]